MRAGASAHRSSATRGRHRFLSRPTVERCDIDHLWRYPLCRELRASSPETQKSPTMAQGRSVLTTYIAIFGGAVSQLKFAGSLLTNRPFHFLYKHRWLNTQCVCQFPERCKRRLPNAALHLAYKSAIYFSRQGKRFLRNAGNSALILQHFPEHGRYTVAFSHSREVQPRGTFGPRDISYNVNWLLDQKRRTMSHSAARACEAFAGGRGRPPDKLFSPLGVPVVKERLRW